MNIFHSIRTWFTNSYDKISKTVVNGFHDLVHVDHLSVNHAGVLIGFLPTIGEAIGGPIGAIIGGVVAGYTAYKRSNWTDINGYVHGVGHK